MSDQAQDVETMNECLVGLQGDQIRIMMPPRGPIGIDCALRLAAWLVVMADPSGDRFATILRAVKNT